MILVHYDLEARREDSSHYDIQEAWREHASVFHLCVCAFSLFHVGPWSTGLVLHTFSVGHPP